jgi:hypothetical protein
MDLLVSSVSTKHSMLKEHWDKHKNDKDKNSCPVTTIGSMVKPKEDQGGVVSLIVDGNVASTRDITMPTGMVISDNGILVAAVDTVHELSSDISRMTDNVVSLPQFNLLHSLSRTRDGSYLVASTGLDAILEFTRDGKLLWSWWSTDNGFDRTPLGAHRSIDKKADHRGIKYGTLMQTTHVNSVAELPDGRILASLFHQGMVVTIDRKTGKWQPFLEGLNHPHSIRIVDDHHITLADTGRGRGLMLELGKKPKIISEVQAPTTWLQDCYFDQANNHWLLVDGVSSRVVIREADDSKKEVATIQLDPEWRLYEVLPTA